MCSLLHLVPMWQSAKRPRKLRVMMGDRPDLFDWCHNQTSSERVLHVSNSHSLFDSELAGLAFDSLQQVFRKVDCTWRPAPIPPPCGCPSPAPQ